MSALERPGSRPGLLRRAGLAARRFMLRTQAGPLRPVWRLCYELLLRSIAAWLRRDVDAAVYVGGTFGHGDPVYGVSDIDLIVVAPDDLEEPGRNRVSVKGRWRRLCARIRPAAWIVSGVSVYEERELRAAVGSTCFTYGLGDGAQEPWVSDEAGLLTRPGLWPTREWRLVAGRDLRPRDRSREDGRRRLNTWLELQFWWRLAVEGCLAPDAPHVPYLCVKLVAEPARMLLWLEHGEQVFDRKEVLGRAVARYPEEAALLGQAVRLHDRLHLSPRVRLDDFLPGFVRLSSRVAAAISAEIAAVEATAVQLEGDGGDLLLPELERSRNGPGRLEPLVDWASLARPLPGDESFWLLEPPADTAEAVAAAARAYRPASYPAFRIGTLLLLALPKGPRTMLRGVQCAASDPVSFALADDSRVALFPEVAGWSALDTARRAAAEHRSRLDAVRAGTEQQRAARLALLLSALRAAIFLESTASGNPQLPLTLSATARAARALEADGSVAEEALGAYRDAVLGGRPPSAGVVSDLERLVCSLPAYAERP